MSSLEQTEVNKAARGSQLRGRGGVWGGEVNNAAGEVNNATDAEVNWPTGGGLLLASLEYGKCPPRSSEDSGYSAVHC